MDNTQKEYSLIDFIFYCLYLTWLSITNNLSKAPVAGRKEKRVERMCSRDRKRKNFVYQLHNKLSKLVGGAR
ncbi:MAG: hypothetical protein CEN88_6 [Candidatus Berkelbacteria bacterium Licking1014_2]|uniref:Uncharacterized protein n=1 Tax=Candidatus Berkelbacteria bacterium Licking1014_2 TaxID=2017146 RepID=A0A554LX94_9BACT|nr:MAG: hypothetical protein CEN88_6 [Candidatus Berkelbacteria bacterium Licking1014_2]